MLSRSVVVLYALYNETGQTETIVVVVVLLEIYVDRVICLMTSTIINWNEMMFYDSCVYTFPLIVEIVLWFDFYLYMYVILSVLKPVIGFMALKSFFFFCLKKRGGGLDCHCPYIDLIIFALMIAVHGTEKDRMWKRFACEIKEHVMWKKFAGEI